MDAGAIREERRLKSATERCAEEHCTSVSHFSWTERKHRSIPILYVCNLQHDLPWDKKKNLPNRSLSGAPSPRAMLFELCTDYYCKCQLRVALLSLEAVHTRPLPSPFQSSLCASNTDRGHGASVQDTICDWRRLNVPGINDMYPQRDKNTSS